MTIHFKFTLPPEMFQNAEQVITLANPLIPAVTPSDLRIEADPATGITITYSIDFPGPMTAAQAIVKVMKGLVPV